MLPSAKPAVVQRQIVAPIRKVERSAAGRRAHRKEGLEGVMTAFDLQRRTG